MRFLCNFGIAAFLLAFAVGAHAQSTNQNLSKPAISVTVTDPIRIAPEVPIERNWNTANCALPQSHDEADLCEQKRMAKAAEDSLYWTSAQAWIGGGGAVLVFFSLIFAGIAAFAASRQVRLSRDALIYTDRAFVFPQTVVWSPLLDIKSDKIINWTAAIQWKNSGNTPTRNLRLLIAKYIQREALPDEYDLDNVPLDYTPLLIAPGNTLESTQMVVSIEECEEIIAGRQQFYLYGWAEYDDVFDATPRHRTEFCYRINMGGNPRIRDKCGLRWNIHSRHNGADEECESAVRTSSRKDLGGR